MVFRAWAHERALHVKLRVAMAGTQDWSGADFHHCWVTDSM